MQIRDKNKEEFFLDTVIEIVTSLGYNISREELVSMCSNDYLLHFQPINNNKIHIGIWPVGNWYFKRSDPPTEMDLYYPSSSIDCVYGSEFPDYTICVFCCHDWDMDIFRPSYTHWRGILTFGSSDLETKKQEAITYILNLFKSKIDCYYDLVDFDEVCLCHHDKNKIHAYYSAWFRNVIVKNLKDIFNKNNSQN